MPSGAYWNRHVFKDPFGHHHRHDRSLHTVRVSPSSINSQGFILWIRGDEINGGFGEDLVNTISYQVYNTSTYSRYSSRGTEQHS